MTPEDISVSRSEAAAIARVSNTTLSNWMRGDAGLFLADRRGSGHHVAFNLSRILSIAVVRELVAAGVNMTDAISSVNNVPPYRELLHGGGVFEISKGPGDERWQLGNLVDRPVTISVRLWPLWSDVTERLLSFGAARDADAYLDRMAEIRRP